MASSISLCRWTVLSVMRCSATLESHDRLRRWRLPPVCVLIRNMRPTWELGKIKYFPTDPCLSQSSPFHKKDASASREIANSTLLQPHLGIVKEDCAGKPRIGLRSPSPYVTSLRCWRTGCTWHFSQQKGFNVDLHAKVDGPSWIRGSFADRSCRNILLSMPPNRRPHAQ